MTRDNRKRRPKPNHQGFVVSGPVEQFLKYWVSLPLAPL